MIDKAVKSARFHGINIHAGVEKEETLDNFTITKLRLEELKKIKKKDWSEEQTKEYNELMKLQRNEKNRKRMKERRRCLSADEKDKVKNQDKIRKASRSQEERDNANVQILKRMAESRATQSTEDKEKKKAENTKRMTKSRANQSPEAKEKMKAENTKKRAENRANQSPEDKEKTKAENTKRMAKSRANQSPEAKEKMKGENTKKRAENRANQSPEAKEKMKAENTKKRAESRANQLPEDKEKKKAENTKRMAENRATQRSSMGYKEAVRSQEILEGSYKIADLLDSPDSIGLMSYVCQDCGALKFSRETASTCCSEGKVLLDRFPTPPPDIDLLWHADTSAGRLFREHARSINNAVCLTSIKVKQRNFDGFNPSVIFEGKVQQLAGPLQASPGEKPCFSQLYVLDPSLESSIRFENMTLPDNVSKAQKQVLKGVLETVQAALHDCNPFIKDFKQIIDIPSEQIRNGKIVISSKSQPVGEHERRYNKQINLQEVRIVTNSEPHDLVLHLRGGGLHSIHDLNPKGMPLHFTLLFPHGTYGWDPNLKQTGGERRVTTRQFYVYYINERDTERDFIHLARRLFQEWICMAWVSVENQKLTFQKLNQKALRADTYKNLKEETQKLHQDLSPREDGMFSDDNQRPVVGRKILSSSFVGSPRWYNAKFQDGMAICREYHKPDYFITMTCNSKWPEIKELLKKGQSPQDRPDIVARVFRLKKDQLMQDLKSAGILGKVVAHMHVVEFQKRGLPHVHILIILADCDRTLTADSVDSIVVAELPPDPADIADPKKAAEVQRLRDIVVTNMIHGPCGSENPSSPCMENGKCSKNFPKDFQKQTSVDTDYNYATYRRRAPEDGGHQFVCPKTNRIIDNRWVVPYCPFLSLRFNCHINVECCTSPKATKYLYKYVTKGSDRAMVAKVMEDQDGQPRDEIAEYEDLRSVGSSEATWHLMAFPITDRYPPVHALRVHTEDQQQVLFNEGTEEEALERQRETELTAFFELNIELSENPDFDTALLPTYVDLPKMFRYDKAKKKWIRRKSQSEDTVIGRVHSVNPVAGETFYLRMLLHNDHCKGKTSFTNLKVLDNGKICETFKEVCREIGLLEDDFEWECVLEESAITKLCPQLRELFIVILMFCQPSDPRKLFEQFWHTWTDDLERNNKHKLTENQLKTNLLLDLQTRLQSFEKELGDFGLPQPSIQDIEEVKPVTNTEPVVIREEKEFHLDNLVSVVQDTVPKFTQEQSLFFNRVMEAVKQETPLLAFLDARGGCGKTFLLNTILAAVRSLDQEGCVALAMGTTGIAANLLELGRTFHSRLKAPLNPTEDSTLQISAQSDLARLIRIAKLILIDESTMLDRYQLEALDRTLRDLMGNGNQLFGGKTILLAGDFRQCLPVVPGANRAGTVAKCINQSILWQNFEVFQLTENMRIRISGDPVLENFDKWTLSIGNGAHDDVKIPEEMLIEIVPNTKKEPKNEEKSMKRFCKEIFPDLQQNINRPGWLEGRTLLAPTNKEVDTLNQMMEDMMPREGTRLSSADSLQNPSDAFRFNIEYLNTLRPNGFAQHILKLKPGMPLMLLRNINPRQGLCNGTRLIFDKCVVNKLLQCRVVETGRLVLIPRITFIPKPNEYPFEWSRRQFPVRSAFAITINKSQGQTLKYAGVWLRGQVFTHGQLYVACSRVCSPRSLKFAVTKPPNDQPCVATNIVFKEVLLPHTSEA